MRKTAFLGNGLSRTAMIFKIATMANHILTVTEMNRIKDVNPRSLERVYDEVMRVGDATNALFALRLVLGSDKNLHKLNTNFYYGTTRDLERY